MFALFQSSFFAPSPHMFVPKPTWHEKGGEEREQQQQKAKKEGSPCFLLPYASEGGGKRDKRQKRDDAPAADLRVSSTGFNDTQKNTSSKFSLFLLIC